MNTDDPVVFVVDDEERVRRAVCQLFESVGLRVAGHGSAREFLDQFDADQPGCLVLDVRMPGLSGLDLQEELQAAGVTLPIVFITGHGDIPMTVRALKAGAIDFIEKPFNNQVLLDAVHAALRRDGEARRTKADRASAEQLLDSLTPREREVLELVITGKPNKQIAAELGTGEHTVKVHRGRVMRKMHADSLPDLIRIAAKAGVHVT